MAIHIPAVEVPLGAELFSGKRRAARTPMVLDVECRGPNGEVTVGRTIDVSRVGMLIELTDGEIRSPDNASKLIAFASLLASTFPDGMITTFLASKVKSRSIIVRLVASPTGKVPIQLGCRFDPPLNDRDCKRLGFEDVADVANADTPKTSARPRPR